MTANRAAGRSERLAVLIAALGGQGGGVLTEWIVDAARAEGLIVQATSTPGVSQRTGATTYYIEIADPAGPGAPSPVLGLAPVPGRVDVLVCAELLEAARMLERGMSTPSRTTVVASTHRVYTTREKMSGADARFDSVRIVDAVRALSRQALLVDMEAIRARHGAAISAVLFGALAGSGALPLARAACENAIRGGGKGVAASLAAFAEAFAWAREAQAPARNADANTNAAIEPAARPVPARDAASPLPADTVRALAALPDRVAELARFGAVELIDYQDARYASRYLDRLARIVIAESRDGHDASHEVAREAARRLALWMRYDDVIRVASRKARMSRLARIRAEAGARQRDVVRIYDLFKPGALEIAAILPRRLGAWVELRALTKERSKPAVRPGRGVTLQTSSVAGALVLRLLAALRPLRPHSLRHAREQQAIEDWLVAIELALANDRRSGSDAAIEVARLPGLIRGYGDSHASGRANFDRLLDAYRRASAADPRRAAAALRDGARAALNDPACAQQAQPHVAAAARSGAASLPA